MRSARQPANDSEESSGRQGAQNRSHSERLPPLLEPAAEIVAGQSARVFAIEALVDRSRKPKRPARSSRAPGNPAESAGSRPRSRAASPKGKARAAHALYSSLGWALLATRVLAIRRASGGSTQSSDPRKLLPATAKARRAVGSHPCADPPHCWPERSSKWLL